ncbi:MAG: hypothetical protein F6K54_04355 [Okeania sp. SIO3B5]|uniref:hypothetical protein n=1 Tax=Okeania sp. SIO3B5 TaxID=2607811 RepID=UPI0013FEB314|nr:hypothetical protein [Okeania sp. SIO3B5]NEO52378.1 hypothetical protein [Okeania sp. SIO3B5]
MNLKFFFALFTIMLLILVNGVTNLKNKITIKPANATTKVDRAPIGRIIEADGKVFLKRQNWSEYHPVFVGTELYTTDKIKLTSEGNLMAICYANWEIWSLQKNSISQTINGCLQAKSQCVETSDGCVPLDATRGINQVESDKIPYIISPRHTLLLPDKPLILPWNPVTNATRYTVIIKSLSGKYIWETEVSENQVLYSGEIPLKTDIKYTVIIHTDTQVSSIDQKSPFPQQENDLGREFAVVSKSEQQEILAKVEELTQKLDGEARVLSIAEFYQQNDLNVEAIAILESLYRGRKSYFSHLSNVG